MTSAHETPASGLADSIPGTTGSGIRPAETSWAALPVFQRLRFVVRLRHALVEQGAGLAAETARVVGVGLDEVLASEVLPLAEACRFLEREAVECLAPRNLGPSGRPLWLSGVVSEVLREPFGVVLILAPSNYPLFLAGVQALQAMVAGNTVLWKPAPGTSTVVTRFAALLTSAGFPDGLLTVLPEDPGIVPDVIRTRADLVILTGGQAAGQGVLKLCAENATPVIAELSGLDACHVLADADPEHVASCLVYGLSLNRGRTCIAPRRIFVSRAVADDLRHRLQALSAAPGKGGSLVLTPWVAEAVGAALAGGASILCGAWEASSGTIRYPFILDQVPAGSRLRNEDHFSPIATFDEVAGEEEALRADRDCPYALGASVFGAAVARATAFAKRLPAPVVTVNDVVVPTADPRLPFGGRRKSGFGVTRGPEGLLAMTFPKVVTRRRLQGWRPYLDPPTEEDATRFGHLLNLLHGRGMVSRWRSLGWLLAHRPGRTESRPPATGKPSETNEQA